MPHLSTSGISTPGNFSSAVCSCKNTFKCISEWQQTRRFSQKQNIFQCNAVSSILILDITISRTVQCTKIHSSQIGNQLKSSSCIYLYIKCAIQDSWKMGKFTKLLIHFTKFTCSPTSFNKISEKSLAKAAVCEIHHCIEQVQNRGLRISQWTEHSSLLVQFHRHDYCLSCTILYLQVQLNSAFQMFIPTHPTLDLLAY